MKYAKQIVGAIAVAASIGVGVPVLAQQGQGQGGPSGHSMQGMPGMNMQSMTAAQKEYQTAIQKMNRAMMQGMMETDPGKSWLKMMEAHHHGAIDMSDIVIKHSKDEDVVAKAKKTKEDNEKDLQEVSAVMRKHGW